MSEFSLVEFVLTGMIIYGPLMVSLALFAGAIGIPVPTSLVVLASGAFVHQGILDWRWTMMLGFVGVICGDSCSYAIGRVAKGWVQRRFGQSTSWQSAQRSFHRRGGLAVYLTRFFVTPLAIPTNLIAGSSGYRFRRFLLFDMAGEFTWLVLYGGLGYLFGSNWEAISQFISDLSGLLAGIIILAVGLYFLLYFQRRRQIS